MKMLQEGIWSNKDLAEWFGITEKTFSNNKKKKLEELKNYARFRIEKRMVVIEEVYKETYEKKKSKNFELVKNSLVELWCPNNLDTCKNVTKKLSMKYSKKELPLEESSLYNYTRASREELFGKPLKKDDRGTLGKCEYEWVKEVDDETNTYEPLTDEERQIFQSLMRKYFGSIEEKTLIIEASIKNGEITKEEAWEVYEELTNMNDKSFVDFLYEAGELIGCKIVRATRIEKDN